MQAHLCSGSVPAPARRRYSRWCRPATPPPPCLRQGQQHAAAQPGSAPLQPGSRRAARHGGPRSAEATRHRLGAAAPRAAARLLCRAWQHASRPQRDEHRKTGRRTHEARDKLVHGFKHVLARAVCQGHQLLLGDGGEMNNGASSELYSTSIWAAAGCCSSSSSSSRACPAGAASAVARRRQAHRREALEVVK